MRAPPRRASSAEHVRRREVADVDVVAQARAVRRRVVVAEDLEGAPPQRRVDRARDHVDLRRVILAQLAVRVGARGIEIAQRDRRAGRRRVS